MCDRKVYKTVRQLFVAAWRAIHSLKRRGVSLQFITITILIIAFLSMQGAIVECFAAFYRGLQATALRLN